MTICCFRCCCCCCCRIAPTVSKSRQIRTSHGGVSITDFQTRPVCTPDEAVRVDNAQRGKPAWSLHTFVCWEPSFFSHSSIPKARTEAKVGGGEVAVVKNFVPCPNTKLSTVGDKEAKAGGCNKPRSLPKHKTPSSGPHV